MRNQIANKILQLSSQMHRGAKVPQRIREIVYQLQNLVIKQRSTRTQSTLSTPSPQNERKKEQMDIQIIPFDLSPIDRYKEYNEIRIQEEEDQLFCKQQMTESILIENKQPIDLKQKNKQFLSTIKEQPDEQLQQSRKKIEIQKQKQKQKKKRFNYLAMVEDYGYNKL